MTSHRARVTGLVLVALPPRGTVTVLGAGVLADLDLRSLLQCASKVTLVDLDRGAVEAGLVHWGLLGDERVRVHAPVDLSRVLHRLPAVRSGGCRQAAAAGLLTDLRRAGPLDLPPADVTLSAGLLTQLFEAVVRSELDTPASIALRLAVRDVHLRDLLHLTRPGGTAILVVDVVSTGTAADLETLPADSLNARMATLVATGNFFTGANPYRIAAVVEETEPFASAFRSVWLTEPWLWPVTEDRRHLTCALLAHRHAQTELQWDHHEPGRSEGC